MKRTEYLNRIYERNPETGNYIIEISLDKYADVFNEWDHASYKKRDLDPELCQFLENCSDDIPEKYGTEICFYLPREVQNKEREKIIANGIKTYYSFFVHSENKSLEESFGKVITYIVVSFALLAAGFFFNKRENSVFLNTLFEGMNVGGWLFLWEAISLFFIKRTDKVKKIRKYERFITSKIIFKYDPAAK